MRLIKKSAQAVRHHRPNIAHRLQLLQRRVHDGVQATEMACQRLGGGLAHVPDAQAEQKARQRGLLRLLQRINDVLRRFVGHAVERRKRAQA